jgi:proteasome assembly chaperone (PAC2) family protein
MKVGSIFFSHMADHNCDEFYYLEIKADKENKVLLVGENQGMKNYSRT